MIDVATAFYLNNFQFHTMRMLSSFRYQVCHRHKKIDQSKAQGSENIEIDLKSQQG